MIIDTKFLDRSFENLNNKLVDTYRITAPTYSIYSIKLLLITLFANYANNFGSG